MYSRYGSLVYPANAQSSASRTILHWWLFDGRGDRLRDGAATRPPGRKSRPARSVRHAKSEAFHPPNDARRRVDCPGVGRVAFHRPFFGFEKKTKRALFPFVSIVACTTNRLYSEPGGCSLQANEDLICCETVQSVEKTFARCPSPSLFAGKSQ